MAKKVKAPKENEELVNKEIEVTDTPKKKTLSLQAKNWDRYLKAIKMTPEEFITRYPNHKFISFIQELVD